MIADKQWRQKLRGDGPLWGRAQLWGQGKQNNISLLEADQILQDRDVSKAKTVNIKLLQDW